MRKLEKGGATGRFTGAQATTRCRVPSKSVPYVKLDEIITPDLRSSLDDLLSRSVREHVGRSVEGHRFLGRNYGAAGFSEVIADKGYLNCASDRCNTSARARGCGSFLGPGDFCIRGKVRAVATATSCVGSFLRDFLSSAQCQGECTYIPFGGGSPQNSSNTADNERVCNTRVLFPNWNSAASRSQVCARA